MDDGLRGFGLRQTIIHRPVQVIGHCATLPVAMSALTVTRERSRWMRSATVPDRCGLTGSADSNKVKAGGSGRTFVIFVIAITPRA
jgi:hypothetical protein